MVRGLNWAVEVGVVKGEVFPLPVVAVDVGRGGLLPVVLELVGEAFGDENDDGSGAAVAYGEGAQLVDEVAPIA